VNGVPGFHGEIHQQTGGPPWDLPGLVNIQKANWNMAIEIVDLPINSMVIFHSYVTVYQRVIRKMKAYIWMNLMTSRPDVTGMIAIWVIITMAEPFKVLQDGELL